MDKKIQALISAVTGVLSSLLGVLYVPILLMVACNVMDYATGLMAAPYRNDGISSYKSMKGIVKKVSMWILVCVGVVIDQVLIYTTAAIGMAWHVKFLVAAVVAIWIICNELISILENIVDIGVKIPRFLRPLVMQIQKAAEKQMETDEKEEK